MFLSNYMEEGFLNVMRGIAFTAPSQVFCRLFLTSPGESGSAGVEVSYSGYTGMPITLSAPTVEGAGIGIRNNTQITFAKSPIDAGTVRHIGIYDSAAGGNLYMYGELTEDLPILAGESPVLLLNEVLFFSLGDMSNAYKTRLFNVIRGTSLPGVTPYYSLWNGNPQSGGSELAGLNYSRVPLTFSAPSQDASGLAIIKNSNAANFNRPTTNWGEWSFSAIHDGATSGEPIWIQQRIPSKTINRGIMPMIEVGAITVGVN